MTNSGSLMNTSSTNTSTPPMPVTKRAQGRSLTDFGNLSYAENILLTQSAQGKVAKIGDDVPADDSDPDKIVRASFLRFLLLGGDEQAPVHQQGVQLCGALVQGQLDLKNCCVPHGMTLKKCKFDEQIIALDAHVAGLFVLSGSHLMQGLKADRLSCASGVFLRDGFQSFAEIYIYGAQIGGNLECSGAQFEPKGGHALLADQTVIKGGVFLKEPFKATGTIRLLGAQIGGTLDCSGGLFEPKEGHALLADHAVVKGGVFLNKQFKATGTVRLLGAQIAGSVDCSGGLFEPKEGDAISADRATINGSVVLNKPFKATGTVRLVSAQIGVGLDCSGGLFEPREGHALLFDHAAVKDNVFLNKQFKATGKVRLLGAGIGGNLECSGGLFEPKNGDALSADLIVVKGNVFLDEQFKATGNVRLLGAQIGGNLACSDGQFEPNEGDALSADGAVFKGDVLLNKQFKATGKVRIIGAQIGGDMNCSGGQFSARGEAALIIQTAAIRDSLILLELAAPVRINATSAQIGMLEDAPTAWAKGSILNGLVYKSLAGTAHTDAAHRIEWLKKQSHADIGEDETKQGFRPQPWKQLQKVLREMGHEADARLVGIAYEDQLLVADRIGQIVNANKTKNIIPFVRRHFLRCIHRLLGALSGYGYRPLRLFMTMVALWLLSAAVYWCLALPPYNAIGPTDPLVFQNPDYRACTDAHKGNWLLCESLPAEYTTFNPLAYSLDILLPLVDLGQEKSWGPLVPTPKQPFFVELFSFSTAHVVRLLNWFEVLYGWVASLLFVAIVSGMSRRSEMEK